MTKFKPFANERNALSIGELQIENRVDRIELYGSLQITRDKAGLKQAEALKALLDATVAALKSAPLPDKLPPPPTDKTSNPFQ